MFLLMISQCFCKKLLCFRLMPLGIDEKLSETVMNAEPLPYPFCLPPLTLLFKLDPRVFLRRDVGFLDDDLGFAHCRYLLHLWSPG